MTGKQMILLATIPYKYQRPPPKLIITHQLPLSRSLSLSLSLNSTPSTIAMAEEQHHHLFHHHKDDEKPVDQNVYSETGYAAETTAYSSGGPGGYGETTTEVFGATTESGIDYRKEEKHHKHLEHVGELGVAAAGAYALVINYFLLLL